MRILGRLGFSFEEGANHTKISFPGKRVYTLPRHNGEKTEVGPHYQKALCDHFGLPRNLFSGDRKAAKKALQEARSHLPTNLN